MPPTAKYNVVGEEEASDRNSTDMQSLYVEEKAELQQRRQAQRLSTYTLWYSALSTLIIILLSVALAKTSITTTISTDAIIRPETTTHTPENCLPRPYRGTFGRHLEYQSVDHRFDILWDDIKDDLRVFWLPDPEKPGEEKAAVIAMFHQLHCLQSFRMAIQMGHEGKDPGLDRWTDDNMHWPHCLDYMRSTILCYADDTLERWSFLDNGTLGEIAEGYFDDRQCGDNRKLIKMMRDAGSIVRTRPFP
ncbi:hypothetical protein QBC34DRAFT_476560 [Podospora aff. communis PSN243]|uniref:Oxidase ustYa n=1 Tax=Podospora aff. communis PSN243 TaxID=3040156 RepID=A0AAV9G6V3_9PEZI|nr:hypothetical protein QBC34DRAFT_476560 [Podospora aff. communis PSN243]